MISKKQKPPAYRSVVLQGLGRVQVPAGVSDDDVLAQVFAPDAETTPKKKTKKKP